MTCNIGFNNFTYLNPFVADLIFHFPFQEANIAKENQDMLSDIISSIVHSIYEELSGIGTLRCVRLMLSIIFSSIY